MDDVFRLYHTAGLGYDSSSSHCRPQARTECNRLIFLVLLLPLLLLRPGMKVVQAQDAGPAGTAAIHPGAPDRQEIDGIGAARSGPDAMRPIPAVRSEEETDFGGPLPVWVSRYEGQRTLSYDVPRLIAVDSTGNVVVTGHGAAWMGLGPAGGDMVTVRYDTGGNELWRRRFGERAHEEPADVAVDGEGNTYVVVQLSIPWYPEGYWLRFEISREWEPTYNGGMATIKYDAQGNEQWVSRWIPECEGLSTCYAGPIGLEVDREGNVWVTAHSSGSQKAVAIKYDPAGNEVWVTDFSPFSPFSHCALWPRGVMADDDGSVYVGVNVEGSGCGGGAFLVKIGAGGDRLWSATWGSEIHALALDPEGNPHLRGVRSGGGAPQSGCLAKFDAGFGQQRWEECSVFAWFQDLVLDDSAHVHVVSAQDLEDQPAWRTESYDESGHLRWSSWHGSTIDWPLHLFLDGTGGVFVSGYESGEVVVVHYAADGAEAGILRHEVPDSLRVNAIHVDEAGTTYLAATEDDHAWRWPRTYRTLKLDWSGAEMWHAVYDSPRISNTQARALAAQNGRTYVAGEYHDWIRTSLEIPVTSVLATYDGNGNEERVTPFESIVVDDVTWDGSGNLYMAGRRDTLDAFVAAAVDAGGNRRWTATLPYGDSDRSRAHLAPAGSDGVYLAGSARGKGEIALQTALLARYSAAGEEWWTAEEPGVADEDYLVELATAHGSAYLATRHQILKFDPQGSKMWSKRFDKIHYSEQHLNAMAVDGSGNVYATGTHKTVKYTSDGNFRWSLGRDIPGRALVVDAEGNVYVASEPPSGLILEKISSGGARLWSRTYEGWGCDWLWWTGHVHLTMDATGTVYGTLGDCGADHRYEAVTFAVDASGALQWAARYGSPALDEIPEAIVVDDKGDVYVTLSTMDEWGGTMMTTLKYAATPVSSEEVGRITPGQLRLLPSYPNPFEEQTTLIVETPDAGFVRLEVFDLLGRRVRLLVNEALPAGRHEVRFEAGDLPGGVYVTRLETPEGVRMGTVIRVR